MHINFERGRPSSSFVARLRALCNEHDVELVSHRPVKRSCIRGMKIFIHVRYLANNQMFFSQLVELQQLLVLVLAMVMTLLVVVN